MSPLPAKKLVVDDDPALLKLLVDTLNSIEYDIDDIVQLFEKISS